MTLSHDLKQYVEELTRGPHFLDLLFSNDETILDGVFVSHRLPCLRKGNKIAVLEVEKANLLADKFCDVFSEEINESPEFEPDVEYPMNTFPWFTEITIYEIIKKWPTSYSVTPDFILTSFIKNIAHVIAAPLAYIFNQSLAYGEVPLRWKHSFITPLLRKEPETEVDNYRPKHHRFQKRTLIDLRDTREYRKLEFS
ncbi:hypothetical protein ANCDUO_08028 [Ancylostoma duodenale]|uniref:Uncharacterized protein n=1 Tax=Ancylostoma duodenale TaxID=51022 RepID=A0A0C2GRE6_9BILA|nr:hypothetical protein ANCDUO_08028 [Ancylostoma duodenale]